MGTLNRVGILGGTFDPVHLGHLQLSEAAATCLGLDTVFLIPSSIPPHKAPERITPAEFRVAMLQLALTDRPRLALSTMELDRGGVSYTIQTLREIRNGPRPYQPVFLVGSDALSEIDTWKEYEAILSDFDLAVVERPDRTGAGTAGLPPELPAMVRSRLVSLPADIDAIDPPPGTGGRIFRLPVRPVAISSTKIREQAAAGNSLAGLVPESVAKYIQDHRLYRREVRL